MRNYDNVTWENININHNLNWPQITDHPFRILIIEGSVIWKTNAVFHLIKQKDDYDYSIVDKTYLYVKAPYEAKYQYPIKIVFKIWKIKKLLLNIQINLGQ